MKVTGPFIVLTAASGVQGFAPSSSVAAPRSVETSTSTSLNAESLPTYFQKLDVVRADIYDTWLPADPKAYEPKRTQSEASKFWVPFVSDPYGHSIDNWEDPAAPEKLKKPKLLGGMVDKRDNSHLWE